MSDSPTVTTRMVRDILVVELPPTLAADLERPFNEKVEYALADTPGVVILDCSKVTVADAAGTKALDFLFTRCAEIDLPVVVAAAGPDLLRMVRDAGYIGLVEVEPTVEDALAHN